MRPVVLLALLALTTVLAGCGRKAPLEVPPAPDETEAAQVG